MLLATAQSRDLMLWVEAAFSIFVVFRVSLRECVHRPCLGQGCCSDGGVHLNLLPTAVSIGMSCHGGWATLTASAYLWTGGSDQTHSFISVPLTVTVFQD